MNAQMHHAMSVFRDLTAPTYNDASNVNLFAPYKQQYGFLSRTPALARNTSFRMVDGVFVHPAFQPQQDDVALAVFDSATLAGTRSRKADPVYVGDSLIAAPVTYNSEAPNATIGAFPCSGCTEDPSPGVTGTVWTRAFKRVYDTYLSADGPQALRQSGKYASKGYGQAVYVKYVPTGKYGRTDPTQPLPLRVASLTQDAAVKYWNDGTFGMTARARLFGARLVLCDCTALARRARGLAERRAPLHLNTPTRLAPRRPARRLLPRPERSELRPHN